MSDNITRLFIFSEETIPVNPLHSAGATTRLIARIAEQLRLHQLDIHYLCIHSDTEPVVADVPIIYEPTQFIHDFDISTTDVGIFVRYNFAESLEVMRHFKAAGGKCIAHLADPHVENTDAVMQERVVIHRQMLTLSDAVIATSEALRMTALQFNENSFHIPDVIDSDTIVKKACRLHDKVTNREPVKLVTSGYPLHHRSFMRAIDEIAKYCDHHSVGVEFNIHTSRPKATEIKTHGDWLDALTDQSKKHERLSVNILSPFDVYTFHRGLAESDVYVIPGFDDSSLTPFQRTWFPKKGLVRLAQGIAVGLPVLISEKYPDSYKAFIGPGTCVISAATLNQALEQLLDTPVRKIDEQMQQTQQQLTALCGLEVITNQYRNVITHLLHR